MPSASWSALLAIALAGRTDDHLVETALTAVVAYGAFLVAERIGASGVLATVAAGLVMGNLGGLAAESGRFALSDQGRQSVVVFWEFAAFVANSLVFLLIGLAMAGAATRGAGFGAGAIAIVVALGARGPRRDRLSDRARLLAHALGVRLARSAFPVVERVARRARAWRWRWRCRPKRPTATRSSSARSPSSRSRLWCRASPPGRRCARCGSTASGEPTRDIVGAIADRAAAASASAFNHKMKRRGQGRVFKRFSGARPATAAPFRHFFALATLPARRRATSGTPEPSSGRR